MRVIFPCHSSQVCFGRAVFLDVNLCDASEQFWEHEIAILRLFVVIIGCRAEHIGPVEGRHRFLLLRTNDQHDVIKSAHDPFRAEQHRQGAGCARRFGMHRRYPTQFRIDLRDKRAKLQLFGELPRVEIANCARLNFNGIDLRVVDRLFAGFDNDVPDRFSFLLQVALKIRAPAAENVN